ncbi:hypothetical protein [Brevibacillus sp. NRS-1366]|uniref:hypothetical protein n=1 Tax=Brevibacillus sp. NRS-1366 TaxID=3233899 RepID=UPI003D23254A
MTPIIILDQTEVKVKSQVFGKIVLQLESSVYVEEIWFQIENFCLHTMSGEMYAPNVHDWDIKWYGEIEDKWYGTLTLNISHSLEINEDDALYAANCAISELNINIQEIHTNIGSMKVNDFSIEWEHVYSE